MIARPVVKTGDGGTAEHKAQKNRKKDKIHVHHHSVSRHAVGSGKPDELVIIQNGHKRSGNAVYHFRSAVSAGPQKDRQLQHRPGQPKKAVILPGEIDQRHAASHEFTDGGGCCGAGDPPVEDRDEQRIQYHVGTARQHRHIHSEAGLLRGGEVGLKGHLQHKERQAQKIDPRIGDTVRTGLGIRAQDPHQWLDENLAHGGGHHADHQKGIDEQGEVPVGPGLVSLSQGDAHHGASSGADHESQGGQDGQQREYQIHRREGDLPHEIGYEKSVDHTVDRREDHHQDRGVHVPQDPAICKMIR